VKLGRVACVRGNLFQFEHGRTVKLGWTVKLGRVVCVRGNLIQFRHGALKHRRHTVSVDNLDEIENMSTDTDTDDDDNEDQDSDNDNDVDDDTAPAETNQLGHGKLVTFKQ